MAPAHDPSKRHARHQVEALATSPKETWEDLMEAIQTLQAQVSSRENEKHCPSTLAAGDLAYLDTRHLSRGRPTPKLDYCWTGPYKVEAVHGGSTQLALPAGSKIHLTVNLSYCYGPQALYTFPTNIYHTSLNPLPYIPHLVHVPLFKSPRLILIT